ncbi:MAG: hypothetical protein KC462_02320, partial [Cyanobacteria bacterium HKST-UBA05]|nr:hypothetical protein [Cyanobacteria bacterium HKST-UBA05]
MAGIEAESSKSWFNLDALDLGEMLASSGILLASVDLVYNWARSNSVWPMTFATSCCGIEMMSTSVSN